MSAREEREKRERQLERQVVELNRRYAGIVYAIANRYARDPDDADDLAQAVWLKVIECLPRKKSDTPMRAWLIRVAKNVAMKHSTKASRWKAFLERLAFLHIPSEHREVADELEPELARQVDEAVESLPPVQRETVRLRDYQGLSVAETAERQGSPQGTVKANHHKALKNLRRMLAPVEGLWHSGDVERKGDER